MDNTEEIKKNKEKAIEKIFTEEAESIRRISDTNFKNAGGVKINPIIFRKYLHYKDGITEPNGRKALISNGKTINYYYKVNFNSKNFMISNELSDEIEVGIVKVDVDDNKKSDIIYYIKTPELGTVEIAKITNNPATFQVYNYNGRISSYEGDNFEENTSMPTSINDVEIEKMKNYNLREILLENIKNNSIIAKYEKTIMSGFDEIYSLDGKRKIQSITEEIISNSELLKENEHLKISLKDSKQENEKLKSENDQLSEKIKNLEEKVKKIEEDKRGLMSDKASILEKFRKALNFIDHVKNNVLGRLVFKKQLEQIDGLTETHLDTELPEGEEH